MTMRPAQVLGPRPKSLSLGFGRPGDGVHADFQFLLPVVAPRGTDFAQNRIELIHDHSSFLQTVAAWLRVWNLARAPDVPSSVDSRSAPRLRFPQGRSNGSSSTRSRELVGIAGKPLPRMQPGR